MPHAELYHWHRLAIKVAVEVFGLKYPGCYYKIAITTVIIITLKRSAAFGPLYVPLNVDRSLFLSGKTRARIPTNSLKILVRNSLCEMHVYAIHAEHFDRSHL